MVRPLLGAVGLLLFAVAGCASEKVDAPPPVPVDWHSLATQATPVRVATAKERAVAEAYVKGLSAPSLADMAPLFDDIAHIQFGRKDARGVTHVTEMHEKLFGAFDDRKSTGARTWRTADMQIVEWVVTGTHARPWMGVAATKKPVTIRGLSFLTTKDEGAIVDVHVYFNVAAVKAELGVGPKELVDYVGSLGAPSVQPSAPVDQEGVDLEKANKAAVHGVLDALEEGKEKEYLDAFADDAVIETATHPAITKKDDVRAYFKMMRRSLTQLDTTVASNRGIGSFVLVEYMVSGDQRSPIDYVPPPPDHDTRVFDVAEVLEMRDGKIAHVWRYDFPDWAP